MLIQYGACFVVGKPLRCQPTQVWKGTLLDGANANVPEYMCAVKTVLEPKGSAESAAAAEAAEVDLLKEALLMAQVETHKHLVSLIGVVTRGRPKMLVLSFCEHGELQGRLTKNAANGTPFDLATKYRFCHEIASGMKHLATHALVHRDLAARNVLLASGMVCKVADFETQQQVLKDLGLIDALQVAGVPRELKRAWLTMIELLGHGNFGEVSLFAAANRPPRHPVH